MDALPVRFHFSGKFLNDGKEVHYRGGRKAMSVIDRDKVSLPEVVGHLRDHYEVKEGILLHWLFPGKDLSTGLRVLVDDKSCQDMSDCIVEGDVAEIYVEDPAPAVEEISDDDIHGAGSDYEMEEIGEEESGNEAYAMEEPDVIERQVNLVREFYSRPFKRAGRQSAHKEVVDSSTSDSDDSFTCDPPGGMGKDDGRSKKRARVGEDDGSSKKRASIGANDGSSKKRAHIDEEDDAIRVVKRAHIDSGRSGSGGGVSDAAVDNVDLRDKCFCLLSRVTPFEDDEWIRDMYIVAEDIDQQTILSKIEELLKAAALSLVKGNGFSYEVPARNPRKMSYLGTHGIVHERGELITIDFSKNFRKAIQMTCALSVIAESIRKEVPLKMRFVYCRHKEVFGSYEVACTMLDHICCMFGCTMSSLNISIERKGSVIGPLEVKLRNGQILDCSVDLDGEGQKIPRTLSIESFKHHAKRILVVEKQTIFHHLLQMRFHIEQNCIMVTGSGEPDIATRGFLNGLHAATKLPVYALMDPDPFGVQILFVYAFGSVNMSHANWGLAVPEIQWIGLWHSDLQDAKLRDTYFTKTTASEKNLMKNLLGHNIPDIPPHWKNRMLPMLKTKASIEALFSVDFFHLSKVLLPELFAQKDSEPTQLEEAKRTRKMLTSSDDEEEEH